jgi:hypothetical protein
LLLNPSRCRWATGVNLAVKLNAEFISGRATRPALEIERRLASCRRCDQFRGDDCAELELQADGPSYLHVLIRADLNCHRWSAVCEEYRSPPTIGEDALARLHAQGVTRSQLERRQARRECRRRSAEC